MRHNAPPSESEAYSTGYELAARSLRGVDELTLRRCKRLWMKQRAEAQPPVSWGLDGMLHALRVIEQGETPKTRLE